MVFAGWPAARHDHAKGELRSAHADSRRNARVEKIKMLRCPTTTRGDVLRVGGYDPTADLHICIDETGKERRIDIMVDGGFPGMEPKSLIGKTIHIDYAFASVEIAHGVEVIGGD